MIDREDMEKVRISQILTFFLQNLKQDTFTVHELVVALKERSFGILLLIIAIPNACLIASIPMVSFVFGVILILVSTQIILRYPKPILPYDWPKNLQ